MLLIYEALLYMQLGTVVYLAWYMRGTDPFCGRVFMCVVRVLGVSIYILYVGAEILLPFFDI